MLQSISQGIKALAITFLSAKESEEAIPSEEEFLTVIRSAQKADHQIYTKKEQLAPISFGLNASLPSAFNLFALPVQLCQSLTRVLHKPFKKLSCTLEESCVQLTSQTLNLCSSLMLPLLYLGTLGLIIAHRVGITVIAQLFAISYAGLEIALNIYHLYKDYQFSKTFNLSLLTHLTQLTSSLSIHHLRASIQHLSRTLKKHPLVTHTETQDKLLATLHDIDGQLKNSQVALNDAQSILQPIIAAFKKDLLTEKMQTLGERFFSLSAQEKHIIDVHCQYYYQKHSYPTALYHSFALIQERFKEKKILLAQRVQPWLALKTLQEYRGIMEQLQSQNPSAQTAGIEKAITTLERLDYNCSLKRQIRYTNIALFGTLITSALLTFFSLTNPISSIIVVILISLFYYFNEFRINAVLDSTTYDIDWINCCPNWTVALARKIRRCFYKPRPIPPLAKPVIDITSQVRSPN